MNEEFFLGSIQLSSNKQKNPCEHIKVGIQRMKHQSSRLKVVDQEPWFVKL
jgi:hypothetical protein